MIVTPALADANNGNWQTARRWARMLAGAYRVTLVDRWTGSGADLMIDAPGPIDEQQITDCGMKVTLIAK